MGRPKKPLTRAQRQVVRDEAEAEVIHQARTHAPVPEAGPPPLEPEPDVPIVVTLMDAEERAELAEIVVENPPFVLEHEGHRFQQSRPKSPESWRHWIYRQLTR